MSLVSVARALLFAVLLLSVLCQCALAKEGVPASGTIAPGSVYSLDYKITGVDLWSNESEDIHVHKVFGYAEAPVVTISGALHISAAGSLVNEFKARIIASTMDEDANGNFFGGSDYIADGPKWEWQGNLDGRDSRERIAETVPFTFNIPVPAYDAAAGVKHINLQVQIRCRQTQYSSTNEPTKHGWTSCQLDGVIGIPEDMVARPTLSISNGGQLDPLRFTFKLIDNTVKPPAPVKNTVIRVHAPVPGKPASQTAGSSSRADWSLSGYFMSKTKCPNCDWKQAGSQYTSDIYYFLKDPAQPIEVLTDDNGQAELLFFLDLPALGANVPRRDKALSIPIQAEYVATAGDAQGKALAESSLEVNLNHLGYIVSVTYVQPQEWEAWGGLGDVKPAAHNPAEYALDSYSNDAGTGLPYDDVRGGDRAKIAIQMSDTGGFAGYGVSGGTPALGTSLNAPGERLRPGMLFAVGDRIDLDARGLLRAKSSDPQDPASQMHAMPGWVWVKFKFFDGLKAKVGVSGVCGQHSLTFGNTPEASGWVPTDEAFIYWAAKEAAEQVVSKMIPIYGQIDLVDDMAGYMSWTNHGWPAYIRVQSDIVVSRGDDGSATLTVREGQPAVVTEATGFAGVKAVAGESAVINVANQVSVAKSSAEQISYADALLRGMLSGPDDSAGLKPIEVSMPAAPASGGYVDEAGDVPLPVDEAGDVPLPVDEAGDVPLTGLEFISTETIGNGASYSFDEFTVRMPAGWVYIPESADSFASFGNDDLGLYLIVARAAVSSTELLGLMEMDFGKSVPGRAGGRSARLYSLLDNGAEFGNLLSFDEPLANGNNLHVMFMADSANWPALSDMVDTILAGMSFSR